MKQELILCSCNSSEHQMIIRYFENDVDADIYVDVHLTKLPFFKRLVYAIKYIFGYQSKFGAFDEIVLGAQHIKTLENVVKHIKKSECYKQQLKLNL